MLIGWRKYLFHMKPLSSLKPDKVVLWPKPDHIQFVCPYFENLTGPGMFLICNLTMAELFSRVKKARCSDDMADWRVFYTVWRDIVWNRKAAYPVEFLNTNSIMKYKCKRRKISTRLATNLAESLIMTDKKKTMAKTSTIRPTLPTRTTKRYNF